MVIENRNQSYYLLEIIPDLLQLLLQLSQDV